MRIGMLGVEATLVAMTLVTVLLKGGRERRVASIVERVMRGAEVGESIWS